MTEPCRQRRLPYRAVLFDFDGTLADTYPGIAASVNHVRGMYRLPPLPEDEVRRHVGRGPAYLVEQTVPDGDNGRNEEAYKAHQPTVLISGTRLFPGVSGALHCLKSLGYDLGICSNKPRAFTLELLDHFGFTSLFSRVFGPEDVTRPKPAPDMLHKALELLQLDAAATLYVGDMVVDIDTARAAGVAVWVVPTGSDSLSTLEAHQPDRLLKSLADLPRFLAHAGDF